MGSSGYCFGVGDELGKSNISTIMLTMMTKLIASTFAGAGKLLLYLDDQLIIRNAETVSKELDEGQTYVVQWFVEGVPGSAFTISISSPREAQFQLTRQVGNSGKEYGGFHFKA